MYFNRPTEVSLHSPIANNVFIEVPLVSPLIDKFADALICNPFCNDPDQSVLISTVPGVYFLVAEERTNPPLTAWLMIVSIDVWA